MSPKEPTVVVTVTMRAVRGQKGDHKHMLTLAAECNCGCTQMELFEMHNTPTSLMAEGMWAPDGPAARAAMGHPLGG